MGGQITNGIRPYAVCTPPVTIAPEPAMTSPGRLWVTQDCKGVWA